jgi:quinol monooxygenase YgiN
VGLILACPTVVSWFRDFVAADGGLENHELRKSARDGSRLTDGVNMATIAKGADVVTLVNVFTVKPDDQQQLAALLVEATERTMRHLPGFVSASIHKSFDGTRVINYAQWRSQKDFQALRDNQEAKAHMDAAAALASFEPMLCEVVDSISVRE